MLIPRALAIALALLTMLSGCGLLGDDDKPKTSGSVEKARLRVGVLPVVDVGPLYLAIQKGYFKAQGVDVEPVTMASGAATINGILSGDIDISFSSYPASLLAQGKKVAELKIVAEALAAKPGHLVVAAPPDSLLKKPRDMPGKKIAITARNTMTDLAPMAVMESQNVDHSKVKWVEMPLPEMIPAMDRGDVDGAVLVEPFVTRAKDQIEAVPVLDAVSGPMSRMPMAGYVAVDKFATANPKTLAAFRRGLAKAQAEAQSRSTIEPILVKYLKIDARTARKMTIATYSTSLDARRVQRVADLMEQFGAIKGHLDVATMLLK